MPKMKRSAWAAITAALLAAAACPLWADTSAGLAAFKRGDYATALKEWKAAAQKGQPEAEYDLGLLYAKGLGVARDLSVAQQWYEAAALQGNSQAEFSLGQMYAQGWGIPPDEGAAVRWMEMATNGNSEDTDLAWLPIEGYGVQVDYAKAAYWYRLAADQGHPEAQFELAELYSQGRGVPRDQTESFKLTKAAASQGFTRAATALGWLYANGRGVEKDEKQAFFWYTDRRAPRRQDRAESAHPPGGAYAARRSAQCRNRSCRMASGDHGRGQKVTPGNTAGAMPYCDR